MDRERPEHVKFPVSRAEKTRLTRAAESLGVERSEFVRHELGHVLSPPYLPGHAQARVFALQAQLRAEDQRIASLQREHEHACQLRDAFDGKLDAAAKALDRRADAAAAELKAARRASADLTAELDDMLERFKARKPTARAYGFVGFGFLGYSAEASAWMILFALGATVLSLVVLSRFPMFSGIFARIPGLRRIAQWRRVRRGPVGPTDEGAPKAEARRHVEIDDGRFVLQEALLNFWTHEGTFQHRIQAYMDQDDGLERARLALEEVDFEAVDENGQLVPVYVFIGTQKEVDHIPLEVRQNMASRRSRRLLPPALAGVVAVKAIAKHNGNGNGNGTHQVVETGATTPAPDVPAITEKRKRGRPTKAEAEERKKREAEERARLTESMRADPVRRQEAPPGLEPVDIPRVKDEIPNDVDDVDAGGDEE